ncbi:DMT family transporter [Mesorhizobium shangrilense]|uniref:SMR family transporter n=1 Tax=Mesorhizobium shangrilense TaxID=460060 RepID=A0ABV2DLI8_9HYPH
MHYSLLGMAIAAEVIGTTALHLSEQFTRLIPALVVVVAYTTSFYLMSWTMKVLPIGIVYAVWSGVGIASISAVGHFAFGQKLDAPALLGIGLIVLGIIVIQLFSHAAHH